LALFLKRIDVIGFKSFADKTGIDFSTGITAVVGPNGSGKSNIADAIRWVLGEQSAKNLRGAKMEDVIFAGSETRRSINFCEVSLTLDNSDRHLPVVFDEVTITRRVYRSGESEYMLNKQSCRLKDITEVFMDSGMGRESYSIIGQGKIEEMLSTRAEDRRGPFEDAAGIVKYKFRRKETERKLEETDANILRVDDILAELERQAEPLQKQASIAQTYKALDGELQTLDISLLVNEIQDLQIRWKDVARSVEELSAHRQGVAEQLQVFDSQLQAARTTFEAQHLAAEQLQRNQVDAVENRQRTEGNMALLDERLANTKTTIEDKEKQKSQVQAEIAELTLQLTEHERRRDEIRGRLELKTADLEVAVHAVDPAVREAIEQEIAQFNADLIETHHQAAALRNEQKTSLESMANDERKRERLQVERDKWEAEVRRTEQDIELATVKVEEMETVRQEQQQALTAVTERYRDLAKQEAECVSHEHRIQSQTASLKSRYDLLKELEEGYDGFALGVKTVLQAANKQLQGIHGAVASIVRVPKDYETAMETALGGTLQNIVVASEADARGAIDMLKKRQAGRATFMPLTVIRSRRLGGNEVGKVNDHPGYVGVASDLVGCDDVYRPVIENLLGNVIIAKQLVHANELARLLDYRVRIVTLEGDVVSPGGIMSGGSHARKGPGLLGRSREREEVERRLQQCDRELQQYAATQIAIRNEMDGCQELQRSLAEQMESLRARKQTMDSTIRETQVNAQNAQDRLSGIVWEWDQMDQGKVGWTKRHEAAVQGLVEVEQRIQTVESQIAGARARLEERNQAALQAQDTLTTLKVDVATLAQEQRAIDVLLTDVVDRMKRLRDRDGQHAADLAALQQTITQTEQALSSTRTDLSSLTDVLADLEAQIQAVKQERQRAEARVSEADKRLRDEQQRLTGADEQLHRAEVMAERTDMELNHALNRLGETYHISYEWASEHYPPVTDVQAAKRSADGLKRQIAALGDVQLGAIEEWERLSERMTFLQRERDDLENARVSLSTLMGEIDEEMSARFEQAFNQIRQEFQISFRNLFGGGRADLTLTSPDDLLNTGIDVIAQPPGKKLQNLNLMSGGERALTAMALLFAILRVRPVPFCVLDEVEAALDEANVHRFAQQLRQFSADTQFIVITHRRGTMEEADALYGVTMQESGVSSLIGVRLGDAEVDPETA
jgi:chromosome segregation protein